MKQLQKEMAEKDLSLKVEQLQKKNKELQHLVTKHQTQKHVSTETASAATQTDEVYIITYLTVCVSLQTL